MVKATWIAALVQPYLSAIGLTNSVQPYCRFAIIAMQTMPMNSCIQRYDAGRVAILLNVPASASVVIFPPRDIAGVHAACRIRKCGELSRLAVVATAVLFGLINVLRSVGRILDTRGH